MEAPARTALPEPGPPSALNRALDGLGRPRDELFGCRAPAYLVLGVTGLLAGFVVLVALSLAVGRSLAACVALAVASVAVFVLAGLTRQAVGARARHVLLEDTLLVAAAGLGLAHLAGWPRLATLDAHAVALGVFLVFGRLGCVTSGCCHGRPASLGVRYHHPDPRFGVRLFPIQLVEAAWIAVITAVAAGAVLAGARAGTAAEGWSIALVAGRFGFEFARGDLGRPRWGPLTEAQWIAIAVLGGWLGFEQAQRASIDRTELALVTGAAALTLVAVALRRRWYAVEPREVPLAEVRAWQALLAELVPAARTADGAAARAQLGPRGRMVSVTIDPGDHGHEVHAYAWRAGDRTLPVDEGRALAGLALQRLAAVRVLRAAATTDGYDLWVLVTASAAPATSLDDDPHLVRLRGEAAAIALAALPPSAPPPLATDPARLPPTRPPLIAGPPSVPPPHP